MFGKKYEKGFLASLLASLALHTAGGYEVTKVHEKTTQERLHQDSETAKDVIFLPSTEKELVDDLLKQAGVETLEEIQKNPELTKKIDLGYFFIQAEFLEGKIDADSAQKAILNLKLKRKVFKNILETTGDPLLTLNEIQNEIVDPQLFVNEEDEVQARPKNLKIENDYKKGEALASSYFIKGISNCYGTDRAAISIIETVLPTWNIKINELFHHVRLIVEDRENSYLVDPGSPIRTVTAEDLEATMVYQNARISFLNGILKLPNSSKYYPKKDATEYQHDTQTTTTDDHSYKNTVIGNYFDLTTTTASNKAILRALNKDKIPQSADRKRVDLPKDLDAKFEISANTPELKAERKPDAIQKNIARSAKVAKKEIVAEKKAAALKHISKTENKIPAESYNTSEDDSKETESEVKEKQDMAKLQDYQFTSFHIQEQLMGVIEYPDKKVELEKELMLMFKKIDDLEMLPKFTTDHQDEIIKMELLKPKTGEVATSYLAAKFLVMEYLKKYQEFKNNFDDKKNLEQAMINGLSILKFQNDLRLSDYTQNKENNPFLSTKFYGIKKKDMGQYLKEAEDVITKIHKNKINIDTIYIDDSADKEAIPMVLDFATEHPPREIFLQGEFNDLEILQQYLDTPKAKNTIVNWQNPPIGVSLEKIWKAVEEQKIHLYTFGHSGEGGFTQKDYDVEFPLIDRQTKTIVNVNTPELRKKFGNDFTTEFIIRRAMSHSNMQVFFTAGEFADENDIKKLSDKDIVEMGRKILKFADRGDVLTDLHINQSVTSLEWLHAWSDMGLLTSIQTCNLSNMKLSIKELTKDFDNQTTLNFTDTSVTEWPDNHVNVRLNFMDTTFLELPTIDFLKNNSNINFGEDANNAMMALTAKNIETAHLYQAKQAEVEQHFLKMVAEFKPKNMAFSIDLSSIANLDKIKCATNVWHLPTAQFTNYSFSFNRIIHGKGDYGFMVDIIDILEKTGVKNIIIIEHGIENEEQKRHFDNFRQTLDEIGVKYKFDKS